MQFNRKNIVLQMILHYGHERTIEFAYMTDKEIREFYINVYKNERQK